MSRRINHRKNGGCHLAVALLLSLTLVMLGCGDGADGAAGADGVNGVNGTNGVNGVNGVNGTNGVNGVNGTNGTNATALTWVGSAKCKTCHSDHYNQWIKSGHPYKLTKIAGKAPTNFPFSTLPANPPSDDYGKTYAWTDVSYMIGGYGWKARFMDKDGYIITGKKVQYNLETKAWVAYHDTEKPGTKKYDCGPCHTSGYRYAGNQGSLKGITGTWQEEGITCEECHGPGSQHIATNGLELMLVDRDPAACGKCHLRGSPTSIDASGGFIKHHEQWEEMYQTKKKAMDCVSCHNPHESSRYKDATTSPTKGITTTCESCHYQEAQGAVKVAKHTATYPTCITCHMPEAVKSAVGDATKWDGDVKSHLFRINTSATAKQFDTAGTKAMPYLTIGFACKQCHYSGGAATVKTDAVLSAAAKGYHVK